MKSGETLSLISRLYGMNVAELMELNNLRSDRISIGQKLSLQKQAKKEGLVVFKFWKKISPLKKLPPNVYRFIGIVITFNFITFTRTWFRSPTWDGAWQMLYQIKNDWNLSVAPEILASYSSVFWVMLVGFIIHWLPASWKGWYRQKFAHAPVYLQIAALVITVFALYQVLTTDMQPFIYFDF